MKAIYRQIHREVAAINRGAKAPSRVFEIKLNTKGQAVKRALSTTAYQRKRAAAWQREQAIGARQKLGLSQNEFARLLGISVRTLHNWERGSRKPTGAARVLLKLAASNPRAVLKAAA